MSLDPEHIPEPDEDGGPLSSLEAFLAWRKANPEKAAALENQMRRVAAGEYGELTPEIIESAKRGIAANEKERAVQSLLFDFQQLAASIEAAINGEGGDEQLPEFRRMADELVNEALGLAEPYRSNLLPGLISLRDSLLKIQD